MPIFISKAIELFCIELQKDFVPEKTKQQQQQQQKQQQSIARNTERREDLNI